MAVKKKRKNVKLYTLPLKAWVEDVSMLWRLFLSWKNIANHVLQERWLFFNLKICNLLLTSHVLATEWETPADVPMEQK